MRRLRYICLICLLLVSLDPGHAQTGGKTGDKAGDETGGQTGEPPAAIPARPRTPTEAADRRKAWFDQCMQDWDKETHMSKTEWERTCRRMAHERMKFLLEQR